MAASTGLRIDDDPGLGIAFESWARSRGEIGAAARQAVWVAMAERRFLDESGLREGQPRHRSEMLSAALVFSRGMTQKTIHAMVPNCAGAGPPEPGGLFGGCGMPDKPEMPDNPGPPKPGGPDPSPAAMGGGSAPAVPNATQVPAWMMPGSCYGIDPRYLFGGGRGEPAAGNSVLDKVKEPPPKPKLGDAAKEWLDKNILDHFKINVKSGDKVALTLDFAKPAGEALFGAIKGATTGAATFTVLGGSFRLPAPDKDTASLCGQSFAAALAGCMSGGLTPAQAATNLVCEQTNAPVTPIPGPPPARCRCEKGGGGTPAGANKPGVQSGGGKPSIPAPGSRPCCPRLCVEASPGERALLGACGDCDMGGRCSGGGGDSAKTKNLVDICAHGGIGEPVFSRMCGTVDPSPLRATTILSGRAADGLLPHGDPSLTNPQALPGGK